MLLHKTIAILHYFNTIVIIIILQIVFTYYHQRLPMPVNIFGDMMPNQDVNKFYVM
jgi:hypothetical protein